MKIGVLTVHLPTNYGNALQMLALHRYLRDQGHDAEVLSHWCEENKREISLWHDYRRQSILKWIAFAVSCLTWTGKFCALRRETKIAKWLAENVRWSSGVGWHGEFPTADVKYDAVIVGSDQVWNSNCEFVRFFFLPDFQETVKRIAYAASFNSEAFPEEDRDFCRKQLLRFSGVSVRESSSVDVVRDRVGVVPVHVCDPVLLYSRSEWMQMLSLEEHNKGRPFNMCYIVSPAGWAYYDDLIRIAKETHLPLHVYAFACTEAAIQSRNPLRVVFSMLLKRMRLFASGVRLHFSADPTEFLQRMCNAEGVFTDSFHGMMFATIFEKRCNVVVGTNRERQEMKAKLVDFVRDLGFESALSDHFDVRHMQKLGMSRPLQELIVFSKSWLKNVLEKGKGPEELSAV